MDDFKIELYKKENPLSEFPQVTALNSNDMVSVRQSLSKKLNVHIDTDGKNLLNLLVKDSSIISNYDACTTGFLVADVLNYLELVPKDKIYINWYQFDDIDIMNFNDFNKYFEHIWFPSADDIEIFDSTYDWILFISHNGSISCNRLSA
jgi:hypothetical protein